MGYSRFQVDDNGQSPLNIAIDVGCVPAAEALLKGLAFSALNTQDERIALDTAFLRATEYDDSRLHDILIECLLRHGLLSIPEFLPYHELAWQWGGYADSTKFARKLFIAGFQNVDSYDKSGYTPLMIACANGNIRIASFLLQHGADPFKYHEHAGLRAGHFLCYDGISTTGMSPLFLSLVQNNVFRSKEDEKRLIEAAFDAPLEIESRCRCSPGGFTPITSMFRDIDHGTTYDLKGTFQNLIHFLGCSSAEMKRYWRAFVVCVTFNRLGMTHTCIKLNSPGRLFPDNRRIEIEDEEQELFFELEEIAARFDLFSENTDDLSDCVDEFFDDLDWDLPPRPFDTLLGSISSEADCLEPGEPLLYLSSRGERIKYGYKEIVKEESMLRWLFP